MLGAELLQTRDERRVEVLNDINVGLASRLVEPFFVHKHNTKNVLAETCLDERDVWTNSVDDGQKVFRRRYIDADA